MPGEELEVHHRCKGDTHALTSFLQDTTAPRVRVCHPPNVSGSIL